MTPDRCARVRALNDRLRREGRGGQIMATDGVLTLTLPEVSAVVAAMRDFDAFTTDNDPYGEHDFGAFQACGRTFFFKIDYYDPSLRGAAEDPADEAGCARVLTLMLPSEY